LRAEAYFLFGQDHWVIVAPAGGTIIRPVGGAIRFTAKVLRASLSETRAHPPRLSVEALDLTFSPPPGSATFSLASAEELHFHTRAGPHDQGAAYLEIDKAAARSGVLADLALGAPLTLVGDGIFSQAAALTRLSGADQGLMGGVRRWNTAGGRLDIHRLDLQAGTAGAEARTGTISIGPDGRLRGVLPLTLKAAPRLLAAIAGRAALAPETLHAAGAILAAHEHDRSSAVTLEFQAGQTTLGPVAIGPAPRLYAAHLLDEAAGKPHT
jgi:hypothetical protein